METTASIVSPLPSTFDNFKDLHYDSTGIICISHIIDGKWDNHYGRYQAMLQHMASLDPQYDVFFSQNTFKKFRRSTEHLFELKALYIDLDYYKRTHYTKGQVLGNIDILVEDRLIPKPTHIIDSGHGINLIWRIKRTPSQALPLWRALEEHLFHQLEPFGADRHAIDVTRVFRPVGTLNTKYTDIKKVEVIDSNPIEYDIHDLKEFMATKKPKQSAKASSTRSIVRLFNRYSLYYSRYQDLLAICKLREFDVTGCREKLLFLYRYYGCVYLQDEALALQNALSLNAQFTEPLDEAEVKRATRSAERAAAKLKYGYRNKTLIEVLDITPQEMSARNAKGDYYLKSIINQEEKYRRNNQRRYEALRNASGLTQEEVRQYKLLEAIESLRSQGMTQKETAKALDITVRTVQKYERQASTLKAKLKTKTGRCQDVATTSTQERLAK